MNPSPDVMTQSFVLHSFSSTARHL